MQLNTILQVTGDLLQGSGESPAADSADTAALLPFAAVLSGTLTLLGTTNGEVEAGIENAQPLLPEVLAEEADVLPSLAAALLPEASVLEASLPEASLPEASVLEASLPKASVPEASVPEASFPDHEAAPSATHLVKSLVEGEHPEGALKLSVLDGRPISEEAGPQVRTEAGSVRSLGVGTQNNPQETPQPAQIIQQPARSEGQALSQSLQQAAPPAEGTPGLLHQDTGLQSTVVAGTDAQPTAEADVEAVAPRPAGRVEQQPRQQQPRQAAPLASPMAVDQDIQHEVSAGVQSPKEAALVEAEIAPVLGDFEAVSVEPEGTSSDEETKPSTKLGPKADATTDGEGEASTGGEGGFQKREEGRGRDARRARRSEAPEPIAARQPNSSAERTAHPPEAGPLEAVRITDNVPEQADPAAMPDLESGLASTEEQALSASPDKTTAEASTSRVRAAGRVFAPNRAVPMAWLRAALNSAQQAVFSQDGWKVLEMNLDEGEGTVTIKARRDEGRVAVSVGFSDPELRALASAHADRLQEALQAEYEAAVDFSLFSDTSADSHGTQQGDGTAGPAAASAEAGSEGTLSDDQPRRRPLPSGAQHEWVG